MLSNSDAEWSPTITVTALLHPVSHETLQTFATLSAPHTHGRARTANHINTKCFSCWRGKYRAGEWEGTDEGVDQSAGKDQHLCVLSVCSTYCKHSNSVPLFWICVNRTKDCAVNMTQVVLTSWRQILASFLYLYINTIYSLFSLYYIFRYTIYKNNSLTYVIFGGGRVFKPKSCLETILSGEAVKCIFFH